RPMGGDPPPKESHRRRRTPRSPVIDGMAQRLYAPASGGRAGLSADEFTGRFAPRTGAPIPNPLQVHSTWDVSVGNSCAVFLIGTIRAIGCSLGGVRLGKSVHAPIIVLWQGRDSLMILIPSHTVR